MLNKNDPLIGAVQEVMRRNQLEREAVKTVNEKFGIYDRKALPHEKQSLWDAEYKQVLSEAVSPSEYSPKQKQLAKVGNKAGLGGNPNKIDKPDLAAARKGHASHIDESDDMGPTHATKKAKSYKHKTSGKEISSVSHPGKDWEPINEVAPPGREDQVRELKKKFPKKSAFAIAWSSYNKSKKKKMEESAGFAAPDRHSEYDNYMADKIEKAQQRKKEYDAKRRAAKKAAKSKTVTEDLRKKTSGVDADGTEGTREYPGGGGFSPAAIPSEIGGPNRDKGQEAGGMGRRYSVNRSAGADAGTMRDKLSKIKTSYNSAKPSFKKQAPAATSAKPAQLPAPSTAAEAPKPPASVADTNVPAKRASGVPATTGSSATTGGRVTGLSGAGKVAVGGIALATAAAALKAKQQAQTAAKEVRDTNTAQKAAPAKSQASATPAGDYRPAPTSQAPAVKRPAPGGAGSNVGNKPIGIRTPVGGGGRSDGTTYSRPPGSPTTAASGLTTGPGSVTAKPGTTNVPKPNLRPAKPAAAAPAARPAARPAAARPAAPKVVPVRKAAPTAPAQRPSGGGLQSRSQRDAAVVGPKGRLG